MPAAAQVNPAHLAPVPPAIKRQADKAAELQRLSIGQDPNSPPVVAAPIPGPGTPPDGTPIVPTTPVAPAPAPVAPPAGDDLQALLAAERGRVIAEKERNQALQGRVSSLEGMIADLQRQINERPAVQAPVQSLLTPEEATEYGPELLAVMGKRAREEVAGELATLNATVAKLQGALQNMGGRIEKVAEDDVYEKLDKALPGWEQINTSADFVAWLQQPDPYSRVPRQVLVNRAFELKDAQYVLTFFKGYLDEAAATGKTLPTLPTAPAPAPGVALGKVPLETFAAPGRATPTPAPAAPVGRKPIYTRTSIARYHTEKALGFWRGREAEANDIDVDIILAAGEGRILNE